VTLKSLLFLGCLSLSTALFAAENHHVYPVADGTDTQPTANGVKWPGYCEIEVINDSYTNVRVYGMFDDGTMLPPFNIYTYEYPHYISLFYYGYCHAGMEIYIDTLGGYRVYAGYTPTNSSLHLIPYMGASKPKVELTSK